MRVGIRCDAGPATGVGHLIRCVALAEELVKRGSEVTFLTDTGGLEWGAAQLTARGLPRAPAPTTPDELVAAAATHRLDVMVVDSYQLDPHHTAALREAGILVLVVVDGTTRGQVADIYLDQNLGAEDSEVELPAGAVRLAGVRYALLRDRIRSLRPDRPRPATVDRRPRVVCFFGGTDAYAAAPVLTRLLVATGTECDATVVAGSAALRDDVEMIQAGPGQSIEVIGPTDSLAEICAASDLAISAAGTSMWELLCLGTPAALVWVAENQRASYQQVVTRGLTIGLGQLDQLRHGDQSVPASALRRLLTVPQERAAVGAQGWSAVDGRGRERVVDQIELAVAARDRPSVGSGC